MQRARVFVDLLQNHIYLCACFFISPFQVFGWDLCHFPLCWGWEEGGGVRWGVGEKGVPQSFDYRRYSWIQPKPAITQQSLPTASTPHLHQLAWRVIFYMLFWSNSDMLQRQQNAAEKPLMKENETLLMLDHVNQQIAERSLTQRCHGGPHRAASAGGKKTFEVQ